MNRNFDSLDDFAAELKKLPVRKPDAALAHRLEMAIHQADQELRQPTNVVHYSFAQWITAAAAVFVALFMSWHTTRPAGEDAVSGTVAEVKKTATPSQERPTYQILNGRMIPAGNGTMQHASYEGIQVLDGRAYQAFRKGREILLQPVRDTAGAELETATPDAVPAP